MEESKSQQTTGSLVAAVANNGHVGRGPEPDATENDSSRPLLTSSVPVTGRGSAVLHDEDDDDDDERSCNLTRDDSRAPMLPSQGDSSGGQPALIYPKLNSDSVRYALNGEDGGLVMDVHEKAAALDTGPETTPCAPEPGDPWIKFKHVYYTIILYLSFIGLVRLLLTIPKFFFFPFS
jgi:hypothetical protein